MEKHFENELSVSPQLKGQSFRMPKKDEGGPTVPSNFQNLNDFKESKPSNDFKDGNIN